MPQFVTSFTDNCRVGNCNIFVKQKILIINETKWDKILLNQKFMTEKTFVEYRKILLKLKMKVSQLLAIFQCMNES
jgi:hypothetical protein